MRQRLGVVICILIGSFCVYCGQSMVTTLSHDGGTAGPVGSAMGDACCTPPGRDAPTVIFDNLVSPAPIAGSSSCTWASPVFQIGEFRTVVIHTPRCGFTAQVRNGKAGFVTAQESVCPISGSTLARVMTVDPLLGHELRVNFLTTSAEDPDGIDDCGFEPTPLTIVGYKNP
jgi:hypothetical protein